jgi:hypothetical protein
MPHMTTEAEEFHEVHTPLNQNETEFQTQSHIDEMRQEMMELMDNDVRDSAQVLQSDMEFKVVKNRKGERVLSIVGLKSDEYGDEEDTIFVNLDKLTKNKKEDPNLFQTQNPITGSLSQFWLKLTYDQQQTVKISNSIGCGSHASVFVGEYLDMPVAIKVYENETPLSLNAFVSEIESYSKK